MSSRTRLLAAGSVAVVVIAIVIGVVAANSSSGNSSSGGTSGTTAAGSPTTAGGGNGNSPTTKSSGNAFGTTAPGGSPTTVGKNTTPAKQRGTVTVDTGSKFGQSPSSGTCAHWSERFVNNSTVKVVQVTFAPETAFFSKGKKGSSDYVQTPAKAPAPATLNVSIAPKASQSLQFMACTDTAPPAGSSLHIDNPAVLRWKWVDGATGTAPFPT